MKDLLQQTLHRLSFLFILLLAVACQKKDLPDGISDEMYAVVFEIKDFETSTSPLFRKSNLLRSSLNGQHLQEEYLYFWSFNNDRISPDIAVHSGSKITYNNGQNPITFAAGWAFDTFPAGRSLSIAGITEFTFEIPIADVNTIQRLGFDMSSSATGPKAFDLLYSWDQTIWRSIKLDNQFTNTSTAQSKNAFTFQIDTIDLVQESKIWIRIIPKAGERGTSSAYNPTLGVTRIANFHLIGTVSNGNSNMDSELHYYVFDATDGKLITQDLIDYSEDMSLNVELPRGQYHLAFIKTDHDMILPNPIINMVDFHYSSYFSNYQATIFAAELNLDVQANLTQPIFLKRYYSRIKFEFTDVVDLSSIKKIIISPLHQPFIYSPFRTNSTHSVIDQTDIELTPHLSTNQSISFHQFIGNTSEVKKIEYRLDIYGENNLLLRTFDVASHIRNNVQLVFRGTIMNNTSQQSTFSILTSDNWDEELQVDF